MIIPDSAEKHLLSLVVQKNTCNSRLRRKAIIIPGLLVKDERRYNEIAKETVN